MTVEITVTGAVQGIGYRPFVAHLAEQLNLNGTVRNSGGIVKILVTDSRGRIDLFEERLRREVPPGGLVASVTEKVLSSEGASDRESGRDPSAGSVEEARFRITGSSEEAAEELPAFPPDIGICPDCMREIKDPADRRYHYGLISCASCGPRWSILDRLPYDREHTTMGNFTMCPQCAAEYRQGRRRHAQTISCHDCGPQMSLLLRADAGSNGAGTSDLQHTGSVSPEYEEVQNDQQQYAELSGEEGFRQAVSILKNGGILALKGIGGYQFLCSPYRKESVKRLRRMKGREAKPFAVMFPDVDAVRKAAFVSDREEKLLRSAARPIVLLRQRLRTGEITSQLQEQPSAGTAHFTSEVSAESRYIGAFLPTVGIQQLLLDETGPMIVTSANLSGEPIPIDDEKFAGMLFAGGDRPDGIYRHQRRILRPLDDSVAAVVNNHVQLIRRSRGYVPMPVFLRNSLTQKTILAAGGDLKGTCALGRGDRIILSQYLGDLDNYTVMQNYRKTEGDIEKIFCPASPDLIVCDLHPGYYSTRFAKQYAEENRISCLQVQHHQAHAASVMAEHGLISCIGIVFDGTGCGIDRQLWGGEFLYLHGTAFERMGSLSPVKLQGGDLASVNADLAADCFRHWLGREDLLLNPMTGKLLDQNFNTIISTSMGRLFDAVSAMLDICHSNRYEGECAVLLENEAWNQLEQWSDDEEYDNSTGRLSAELVGKIWKKYRDYFAELTVMGEDGNILLDAHAILEALSSMKRDGRSRSELALAFHIAIAEGSAVIAGQLSGRTGERRVCLSGGTFANRLLLTSLELLLKERHLTVYVNEQVPCNDGGVALGQVYLAMLESVAPKS